DYPWDSLLRNKNKFTVPCSQFPDLLATDIWELATGNWQLTTPNRRDGPGFLRSRGRSASGKGGGPPPPGTERRPVRRGCRGIGPRRSPGSESAWWCRGW